MEIPFTMCIWWCYLYQSVCETKTKSKWTCSYVQKYTIWYSCLQQLTVVEVEYNEKSLLFKAKNVLYWNIHTNLWSFLFFIFTLTPNYLARRMLSNWIYINIIDGEVLASHMWNACVLIKIYMLIVVKKYMLRMVTNVIFIV